MEMKLEMGGKVRRWEAEPTILAFLSELKPFAAPFSRLFSRSFSHRGLNFFIGARHEPPT
jgi:hypothetical protein